MLSRLTRPKKWFLAEEGDKSVVIKCADGSFAKKPDATRALGEVTTVSINWLPIIACHIVCRGVTEKLLAISLCCKNRGR